MAKPTKHATLICTIMTCFAIVYALNPDILKQLFKIGVEEGLKNLN
jgi:hypothetical protein